MVNRITVLNLILPLIFIFMVAMRIYILRRGNSLAEKISGLRLKAMQQKEKCAECRENQIMPPECVADDMEGKIVEICKEINGLEADFNRFYNHKLIRLFLYLGNSEIPQVKRSQHE